MTLTTQLELKQSPFDTLGPFPSYTLMLFSNVLFPHLSPPVCKTPQPNASQGLLFALVVHS